MNIGCFAEEMVKNQSFSFSSFEEAKAKVEMYDKFIEYDRITLVIYEHNLSIEEFKIFIRKLHCLWKEKRINKEEKKRRKEYITLFYYIQKNIHLMSAKIHKEERPDFVLTLDDGSRWGIEETELTTPSDKVLDAIMRDFSGTELCEEEIKMKAEKKHGAKANNYYIKKYGKTLVVGAGMFSIKPRKELFSQKILRKNEKYKDIIDTFDKFIILCDATNGIEVISQQDAEDIFDIISEKAPLKNVEISIVTSVYDSINCFSRNML